MTDTHWPDYPLTFLHDAARCLALCHQGHLRLNPHGCLQIGSLTRLNQAVSLKPAHPQPRSEAQAPELAFLLELLGQAGLIGAVDHDLRMTATAYDWLDLPAPLQIQALRQVWWSTPTLNGHWLPPSRARRPLDSFWRQLILETCTWLLALPTDAWTSAADLDTHLASQGMGAAAGPNWPHVRQARERQTSTMLGFLLRSILPALALIEFDKTDQGLTVRPTSEGLAWLRAALERARTLSQPPPDVAVEVDVPYRQLRFPPPTATPISLDDALRVTLAPAAPAAYTFDLAHFARLLSPGPPAHYQLTRRSLEQAVAWGYSISEIRFLLTRFSGHALPPAAAARLADWEAALTLVRCEPGHRLTLAAPALLSALRRREPFRRRTQPLASGQAVWVGRTQARGLWRYLRRLGYVIEPAADETPAHGSPRPLAPALRQRLPLARLLVALGSYAQLRSLMPTLAELGLADLEADLSAALSADERAAVQRLLDSHAALLTRRLGAPHDEEDAAEAPASKLVARLQAAIQAGTPLHITYADTQARLTRRRVRPVRLETYQDQQYLVAFCELRQDERHFRLDRIVNWE